MIIGFCVDGTGTPKHDVTGSVVGSGQRRSLRFLSVHRLLAKSLQSSSALDRVALYVPHLLLDLDVLGIPLVWIIPQLEIDSIRKDGVCVKVKDEGGDWNESS